MSKPISNNEENYENHLDDRIPKWFAVYTYYKREKIAAKQLKQSNIKVYLPIHTVIRRYVRKVKKVELPLINHYVFVKITKKEYSRVLECPYVVHFVKFNKNLISIPEEEIDLIKRILGEASTVELENTPFQKGDQVEVIGGNLTGLKGVLIEKENNKYLSVRLTNIGISLNVSIAVNLLRKIKFGVLM